MTLFVAYVALFPGESLKKEKVIKWWQVLRANNDPISTRNTKHIML